MGKRLTRDRVLYHDEAGNPLWVERDQPIPDGLDLGDDPDRLSYDPDVFFRDSSGELIAHYVDEAPEKDDPAGPGSDPFPEGGGVNDIEEWVSRGAAESESEVGRRAQHALDRELAADKPRSTLVASLRNTLGLS